VNGAIPLEIFYGQYPTGRANRFYSSSTPQFRRPRCDIVAKSKPVADHSVAAYFTARFVQPPGPHG